MLTIDSSREGPAAVIAVAGRMDADAAAAFEKACREAGALHLIVDLGALTYVSSMGLRAFLAVAKEREAAGGQLRLVGLAGFVKQVFDLTRVTPLFREAGSVAGALASLPAA